ncbi:MAG TPA: transposase [bacterium]|mgnify:CR=1 FL=1|nr:transposase [bacterium]HPN42628.1 transposase [bacterium]
MKYNPEQHHRHSIRLQGYDYTQPGGYFITLVTQNRECLFGDIDDGKMVLNGFGKIIDSHWQKIPSHFKYVELDVFQIMPNHIHGIIIITENEGGAKHSDTQIANICIKPALNASSIQSISVTNTSSIQYQQPHGAQPGSLAAIIQNFTSVTSRKINHIRNTPGRKLWQRNYWEHIIRDDNDLNHIREYIVNNPLGWGTDEENL